MLPTFKINTGYNEQYKKIDKVVKLIDSIEKYSNTDWLGEAYIQLIEGKKDIETINVNSYSLKMEKLSKLARSRKEVSLITEEEYLSGFTGLIMDRVDTYEEEGIEKMGIAEEFIELRELVLVVEGTDLWVKCDLCLLEARLAGEGVVDNTKASEDLAKLLKRVEVYYEGAIEIVREILREGMVYNQVYEILEEQ